MTTTYLAFCGRGAPFSVVAVATEACLVWPAVASAGRTARPGCASDFWIGRVAGLSPGRELVRSGLVDIERCLWLLKARYVRGVEATGHRGVVRAAHARIFEEAARMPQLGVYDVDSKSIRRAKSIAGKQQMASCGYRNSVSSSKGMFAQRKFAASAFNSEGNWAGSALTHRSRGQMTDPSPLITTDRQGTLSSLTYLGLCNGKSHAAGLS